MGSSVSEHSERLIEATTSDIIIKFHDLVMANRKSSASQSEGVEGISRELTYFISTFENQETVVLVGFQ